MTNYIFEALEKIEHAAHWSYLSTGTAYYTAKLTDWYELQGLEDLFPWCCSAYFILNLTNNVVTPLARRAYGMIRTVVSR